MADRYETNRHERLIAAMEATAPFGTLVVDGITIEVGVDAWRGRLTYAVGAHFETLPRLAVQHALALAYNNRCYASE